MKEFVGIFNPVQTNLTPFYTDNSIDIYVLTSLDKHFLQQIMNVDFKFGSELFKWLVDQQRFELCINLLKRGFNDNITSILPSIRNYELYTNCVVFYNMKLSISQHPNLLVSAINAGSLSIVKYLLQQPSNTNSDVSSGILETCKTGHHDILDLLLKHKHQPNTQYLYTAIQFNHIIIVRKLVGIGINHIEKNYYCLSLAAKYGHLDIFVWLLEYIQQRPPFKNPPLLISITNAVNEACLNNQITFLLLVFTNKYKTTLEAPTQGKITNEITKTVNIPSQHIIVPPGTLNWLAKKNQTDIIKILLIYDKIPNQHFLGMFKCNSELMLSLMSINN